MDPMLGLLLGLFAVVFTFLIWGRFRYDLVAVAALCFALITGIVPREAAFDGFAHEATVFVALVLVISHGLVRSGAIDFLTQMIIRPDRAISLHIGVMGGAAMLLSAFMNNVAALAILMPIDIQAARKAGRAIGKTLMPLSFGTLLGGLVTLIGTPPNIIISAARENALGEPFQMFDFAPVGLACAIAGLTFIALVGWRLLPEKATSGEQAEDDESAPHHNVDDYVAEMEIAVSSSLIGKKPHEALTLLEKRVSFLERISGDTLAFTAGDIILVEGRPDDLSAMRSELGLKFSGEIENLDGTGGKLTVAEVVVTRESRLAGRPAGAVRLMRRQGVTVAAVSRQGRPFEKSVGRIPLQAGDVLMLVGPEDRLADAIEWLECLPLSRRSIATNETRKALLAITFFAAAIALATLGVIPLAAALLLVVVLYVFSNIVPFSELYRSVEWPVIVLLGAMIPLAAALERTGGTDLIAQGLVTLTQSLPPFAILVVLMALVMTVSDVMNTVATAVLSAPIAIDIANRLNANPDPFLMAVAIAASCAMLTPIGHKNNTIILGPGGYRFGDYWRLGLPVEIIIIAVAVPMIMIVWPL